MKKALIVIDMQNDFINGSLRTREAQAIVPNVAKHLTKAIYEDCLKEEKATVDNIPDFGKIMEVFV